MQLQVDKYWNEIEVGESTGVSRGRTVTETDVVHFMMLTGNWVEIHSNVEFAKDTPFGQRLVQGSLVLAMSQGLFTTGRAVAAFYGLDKLRFTKPVFIGDTIKVECVLLSKKDKNEKFGLATWEMRVTNQRDEQVQVAEYTYLNYKERPESW
ncbi:MaoC/PaaZ C-terminal domain-containing protein [Nocardioides caldifontis]|uniref:MaoC/PaaZ C-terminal domain-containing protein n=1 Tax=Nocardioides caldifontis TaxID=2588938 RepID=UPI00193A155F|nr:MaoC/PaaZ C-terminal domain-containing protein [Nocardioides caldifontis]